MSMLNAANGIHANLVQILYDGQKTMTDLAMKQVAVAMQAKISLQQQQSALDVVGMMSGIGTKIDTVI